MSEAGFEQRRVTIRDPQVMRALAHPARLAIMEHLTTTGSSMTATECAEIVGLSPSATSYHPARRPARRPVRRTPSPDHRRGQLLGHRRGGAAPAHPPGRHPDKSTSAVRTWTAGVIVGAWLLTRTAHCTTSDAALVRVILVLLAADCVIVLAAVGVPAAGWLVPPVRRAVRRERQAPEVGDGYRTDRDAGYATSPAAG